MKFWADAILQGVEISNFLLIFQGYGKMWMCGDADVTSSNLQMSNRILPVSFIVVAEMLTIIKDLHHEAKFIVQG